MGRPFPYCPEHPRPAFHRVRPVSAASWVCQLAGEHRHRRPARGLKPVLKPAICPTARDFLPGEANTIPQRPHRGAVWNSIAHGRSMRPLRDLRRNTLCISRFFNAVQRKNIRRLGVLTFFKHALTTKPNPSAQPLNAAARRGSSWGGLPAI